MLALAITMSYLQVRSKTHVQEEGDLSEDQEEVYETELSQLFSDEDEVKSGENLIFYIALHVYALFFV